MVKQVKAFRLPPELIEFVAGAAQDANSSEAAALEALVADGLRWRMQEHIKPVARHFTDALSPAGVIDFYTREFLPAVDRDAGIGGSHRLEAVPPGGAFEAAGITGYVVLDENETITPDGILRRP